MLWSAHWSAGDQGLFCIAHDISDRKKAEKILFESTRKLVLSKLLPVNAMIDTGLGMTNEVENITKSTTSEKAVKLFIKDIQSPGKEDFFVRVFVNYPKKLTIETSLSDPHYVGSFAFFGSNHMTGHMDGDNMDMNKEQNGLTFVYDITETLRKIVKEEKGKVSFSMINVQLLTVPKTKSSEATLTVNNVAIRIAEQQ